MTHEYDITEELKYLNKLKSNSLRYTLQNNSVIYIRNFPLLENETYPYSIEQYDDYVIFEWNPAERVDNIVYLIYKNDKLLAKKIKIDDKTYTIDIDYYKQDDNVSIKTEIHRIQYEHKDGGYVKAFHREDGPAIIKYYPNGFIESEEFYLNGNPVVGKYGFSYISYHPNGKVHIERQDIWQDSKFVSYTEVTYNEEAYCTNTIFNTPLTRTSTKYDIVNGDNIATTQYITDHEQITTVKRNNIPSTREIKDKHGNYYSLTEPAYVEFHDNSHVKKLVKWYTNKYAKYCSRVGDYPAITSYYPNGNKEHEAYYHCEFGLHRIDGDAIIDYYPDGATEKRVEYYYEGKLQNSIVGNPAVIEYSPIGHMTREEYYTNQKLHSIDGTPAVTDYYPNVKRKRVEYYYEGNLHRTDGPAVINYDIDGNVTSYEFYTNGKLIPIFNNFDDADIVL